MIRTKALFVALAALVTIVAVLSAKLSSIFEVSQEAVLWADMAAALIIFVVMIRKIRKEGWSARKNQ
ncbi:hypothetical protein P9847_07840 [Paenibacillus chibensis]|uniref:Uncharacterized protein n=1 Tax=Paenibacillus chibensis TaxID=59846 RepID=A0ABU6PQR0_9BACL|nr:hypothetical protein [Paenibacillus chibensis]